VSESLPTPPFNFIFTIIFSLYFLLILTSHRPCCSPQGHMVPIAVALTLWAVCGPALASAARDSSRSCNGKHKHVPTFTLMNGSKDARCWTLCPHFFPASHSIIQDRNSIPPRFGLRELIPQSLSLEAPIPCQKSLCNSCFGWGTINPSLIR